MASSVDRPQQQKPTSQPQPQPQAPPSPPSTATGFSSSTESDTDSQIGEPTRTYPLPPQRKGNPSVLPEDLRTPDSHVPRDPRLIRLTGTHPFNVEPPLTDLWEQGFITGGDLHYVRNHGAVPRVSDDDDSNDMLDWALTVEGLVENPLSLTLRDLLGGAGGAAGFEQVTYPVTLVCAGNRRREQNVVRRTGGFSWGAAGLATALWTGVPLAALLARAKPLLPPTRGGGGGGGSGGDGGGKRHRRRRYARYVCFEGADRLPNGPYGTSIKLSWAADPARGVLVAHGMNGEALAPDHGRPLRVVVPGQIGGRSVKWLRRIVVTAEPSDSWYHIYDNRVLPTSISPAESAGLPGTWRDERYAVYDLNTNSVVARPAHDERVEVGGGNDKWEGEESGRTYKMQGYAYAGGGKRVTRVEVSLDRGKSWRLAEVSYPEDDYRLAGEGETLFGGKLDMSWRETCFCWCFWSLDVPTQDLTNDDVCTGDMVVRAMDEAMMVQPRDMYWNVLGMMNNPWYRVVIHREGDALRFEHPTQPASMPGGWMERVKKGGGNLSNGCWGEIEPGDVGEHKPLIEPDKVIAMVSKDVEREVSIEEMKEHERKEEPWFVLSGEVYDGSKFLKEHPGGAASIIGAAGQDVTEEFIAIRKTP